MKKNTLLINVVAVITIGALIWFWMKGKGPKGTVAEKPHVEKTPVTPEEKKEREFYHSGLVGKEKHVCTPLTIHPHCSLWKTEAFPDLGWEISLHRRLIDVSIKGDAFLEEAKKAMPNASAEDQYRMATVLMYQKTTDTVYADAMPRFAIRFVIRSEKEPADPQLTAFTPPNGAVLLRRFVEFDLPVFLKSKDEKLLRKMKQLLKVRKLEK